MARVIVELSEAEAAALEQAAAERGVSAAELVGEAVDALVNDAEEAEVVPATPHAAEVVRLQALPSPARRRGAEVARRVALQAAPIIMAVVAEATFRAVTQRVTGASVLPSRRPARLAPVTVQRLRIGLALREGTALASVTIEHHPGT